METQTKYTIDITQDCDAENPQEWSNVAKLSLHHRRYRLAEECDIAARDYADWESMHKAIERKYGRYSVIAPVFMLDHSGLALRIGGNFQEYGGWDSGQVGFAIIPAGPARKEFGRNWRERAMKCLRGELETYQAYLNGEVYSYAIQDESGEVVDSCGGFYGYDQARMAAQEFITSLENKVDAQ